MAEITGAFIVNHIITKIQMSQDLRLQQVLSDLTRTRLANLVVREVKLGDGLVEHESLDKDADKIIVDEVTWQGEIGKRRCRSQAILEGSSIRHLHTEERSLVLHADMLGAIGERQVAEIGQVLEDKIDVEVLELGND